MQVAAYSLVNRLATSQRTSADWRDRYRALTGPAAPPKLHLAIFAEPYLSWILDGSKSVESRFSAVRCAPWNCVGEGDIVLMKHSSGPVVGAFEVSSVASYQIQGRDLDLIRDLFGDAIRAEGGDFWVRRSRAKYATLMGVGAYHQFESTFIPKRDRRGWVVLSCADHRELFDEA